MILPSKHLSEDRALLTIGADLLGLLQQPKTISRLWYDFGRARVNRVPVTYDWFILALDLLASIGLVSFERGRIRRMRPAA